MGCLRIPNSEGFIDFELIDRQGREIGHRRVTCAEIVEGRLRPKLQEKRATKRRGKSKDRANGDRP